MKILFEWLVVGFATTYGAGLFPYPSALLDFATWLTTMVVTVFIAYICGLSGTSLIDELL